MRSRSDDHDGLEGTRSPAPGKRARLVGPWIGAASAGGGPAAALSALLACFVVALSAWRGDDDHVTFATRQSTRDKTGDLWISVASVILVGLVALFGRFETGRRRG